MKIYPLNDPEKRFCFRCPGCGSLHQIPTAGPNAWRFNGNIDSPTFHPSLLVTWSKPGDDAFKKTCHSFVTNGMIQFLNDCTHKLAGQTVSLSEITKDISNTYSI